MATLVGRRITKKLVDEAEPGPRDQFMRDGELKGFGLKVTPRGVKSYFLEYRMGGRGAPKGRIAIGRHGSPWTPDKARERARELLERVRKGINPAAYRAKENRLAVELAFRGYSDLFIEKYAKRHQVRSWTQAKRVLDRDIKPALRDRPLHAITRRELKLLLEEIADRSPSTARYAQATLRKLFRWAVDRGDIDQSPMADMAAAAPAISRDRVLTDFELANVWRSAGVLGFPFGLIIRLLIATGQRREEVAALRWSEIDIEQRRWTIPAEKAKNARAHVVPLNDLALEVLRDVEIFKTPPGELVFSTTGRTTPSGWSKAKARLDALLARELAVEGKPPPPAWRLHDLRRTMATGLQRLGIRLEVTEAVLNHVSGSRAGIVGVYQRHDFLAEKAIALSAWDRAVRQLVEGGSRTNIVPFAVKG